MSEVLIKDLPIEERPRERLVKHGPSAISTAELLAIILRTGTKQQSVINLAKKILSKTDGVKNLNDISLNQLTEIAGIGPSKAVQIMASIELGKRVGQSLLAKDNRPPIVRTPFQCYELLGNELRYLKQEHFIVLSLDIKDRLIARDTVFIGALNKSVVHPREVYSIAVKRLAAKIICIHNHPSGNPEPSEEDIMTTSWIAEAGVMMQIPLHDHVIIAANDYRSMRALGHL